MALTSLTGRLWVKSVLSIKYNIDISDKIIEVNVRRLTNQLWKLIPMREHEED